MGLATGGWRASAMFKLGRSGLLVTHLPGGFADDDLSREGITSVARRRAESEAGRKAERVVYVGDAVWDVKNAASLGLPFVGIAKAARADRLRAHGARIVLDDFADAAAFADALDRATPCLRLEHVGGNLFALVPGCCETRGRFSEFVDAGSACTSYFYRCCHVAGGGEGF